MERGNSKHGPRLDDQMEREVEALVHGQPGGGRVEGWRDPEAPGEDQPETAEFPEPGTDRPGGTPEGISATQTEQRARFAGYLARPVFPADPPALRPPARAAHGPADALPLPHRRPAAEAL